MGAVVDRVGQLLVDKGLVQNGFILDLNNSLTTPYDMALPAPWSLPSRLFRFPISVSRCDAEGNRAIDLMHPMLHDHPFVQHVAAQLGEIGAHLVRPRDPDAPPARKNFQGLWWHATDLMKDHWGELLATRRFTDADAIARAVAFALDLSGGDSTARARFTVKEARQVLAAIDAPAPDDAVTLLCELYRPSPVQEEKGAVRWPINDSMTEAVRRKPVRAAWSRIYGIERGWFERDRRGFLQWSREGRDVYEAGAGRTYLQTGTGQMAFAF